MTTRPIFTSTDDTDTVLKHYLLALAWSETDDNCDPLDDLGFDWLDDDLAPLKTAIRLWCQRHSALIDEYLEAGQTLEQLGHDLCLTSGHHGVGFWDRGLGQLGKDLTTASDEMPEAGSDMEVWVEDSHLRVQIPAKYTQQIGSEVK